MGRQLKDGIKKEDAKEETAAEAKHPTEEKKSVAKETKSPEKAKPADAVPKKKTASPTKPASSTKTETPTKKVATTKKKSSIYDKLTDATQYTGAHKQRFDTDGKGRGLEGLPSFVVN